MEKQRRASVLPSVSVIDRQRRLRSADGLVIVSESGVGGSVGSWEEAEEFLVYILSPRTTDP